MPIAILAPDPTSVLELPGASPAEAETAPRPRKRRKRLTEADAVDIWIARWLRIRRRDILARYDCDPRRLYEVWQEVRFIGSRTKALELFRERYPGLIDRTDFSRHRHLDRPGPVEAQLRLFD